MTSEAKPTGSPKLNFAKAAKLRQKIMVACNDLIGETLSGDYFRALLDLSSGALRCDRNQLLPAASAIAGKHATYEVLSNFAGFLSVNEDSIHLGSTVSMPGPGQDPGLTPVLFKDLRALDDGRIEFKGVVVWGLFYGRTVTKAADPHGPITYALYRRTRVQTRRRKTTPFPRELVGMHALLDLKARDENSLDLTFFKITDHPYLIARNKLVLAERRKPCLRGYTHPCCLCPIGYNECPRGTRPVTYVTVTKENNDSV